MSHDYITCETRTDLATACKGRRIYIYVSTNLGEVWIRVTKKALFAGFQSMNNPQRRIDATVYVALDGQGEESIYLIL